MRRKILLICGSIGCLLTGAFIASRIIRKEDPVEVKRDEIINYIIDNNIDNKVFKDDRDDIVNAFEDLFEKVEDAKTVDELEDVFTKITELECSLR